jgi:hypothetical protein
VTQLVYSHRGPLIDLTEVPTARDCFVRPLAVMASERKTMRFDESSTREFTMTQEHLATATGVVRQSGPTSDGEDIL